jgi:hypothetical protein
MGINGIKYMSMEMQDQFAHILIGDNGNFLDLGSAHPFIGNNTAALENIGWTGLAFELIDYLSDFMNHHRKTPCFCIDVTEYSPFISIVRKYSNNGHFNYISLDVDSASVKCLELLLNYGITFDVMTFEHDSYLEGNQRKDESKKLLLNFGYQILFEDVKTCSKNWSSHGPMCRPICKHDVGESWEFEDWWIGPKLFSNLSFGAKSIPHQQCIEILRGKK